jgi:hypothetical protein
MDIDAQVHAVERHALQHEFQCLRRGREAIAERIWSPLEDERKAGCTLRHILLDLCLGALDIGVVHPLADRPGLVGPVPQAGTDTGCAFMLRIDFNAVVAVVYHRV